MAVAMAVVAAVVAAAVAMMGMMMAGGCDVDHLVMVTTTYAHHVGQGGGEVEGGHVYDCVAAGLGVLRHARARRQRVHDHYDAARVRVGGGLPTRGRPPRELAGTGRGGSTSAGRAGDGGRPRVKGGGLAEDVEIGPEHLTRVVLAHAHTGEGLAGWDGWGRGREHRPAYKNNEVRSGGGRREEVGAGLR